MLEALADRITNRIFPLRGAESGPVELVHRRVYILPTRQGVLFGIFLAVMLAGSMNYSLSLGYVLTFLLATMAIVSVLHTFRNLVHLRLSPGRTTPVFAGGSASFPVRLESHARIPRFSIAVVPRAGGEPAYADVPARDAAQANLRVPALRRGWLQPGVLRVSTRFPLGLFFAWSNVELDLRCLVYPQPDTSRLPLPTMEPRAGAGSEFGAGEEDFAGMRPYRPGDSPRHIAWKAVAQERGLLTKQFSGQAEAELWLDWTLTAGMETEARLSRLTRWVLDAHRAEAIYGLRIPGAVLGPDRGETHRDRCLQALALFGVDSHGADHGGGH